MKKTRGFGVCFPNLWNVKGFGWTHKRAYRTHGELALNTQIKPRKRLQLEKPDHLADPKAPMKTDKIFANKDTWEISV